jgi:hypothetical protein
MWCHFISIESQKSMMLNISGIYGVAIGDKSCSRDWSMAMRRCGKSIASKGSWIRLTSLGLVCSAGGRSVCEMEH